MYRPKNVNRTIALKNATEHQIKASLIPTKDNEQTCENKYCTWNFLGMLNFSKNVFSTLIYSNTAGLNYAK